MFSLIRNFGCWLIGLKKKNLLQPICPAASAIVKLIAKKEKSVTLKLHSRKVRLIPKIAQQRSDKWEY